MRDDLLGFILQSNAIEGIVRAPTAVEIEAHAQLLAAARLTTGNVTLFVKAVAGPRAVLRDAPNLNVRVGRHVPPPGGPQIRTQFEDLLDRINAAAIEPWAAHVEYETLHPFMDGNGRSGRAIWLWQNETQLGRDLPELSFLHAFYYETLAHV